MGFEEAIMRAMNPMKNVAWGLSFLLGQASAWMGIVIFLGWSFIFALVLPQKGNGWAVGPHLILPLWPPIIGLTLGGLGLLLGLESSPPVVRFSVAGLIFNAIALALALLLLAQR
jgi:hypothetical protein